MKGTLQVSTECTGHSVAKEGRKEERKQSSEKGKEEKKGSKE